MHASSSNSLLCIFISSPLYMDTSQVLLFALLLSLSSLTVLSSDFAADRAECGDRLLGLAPCLAFVQGGGGGGVGAPAPTPSCCMGLKGVVNESPKCLCLLIKDFHEPELGFRINLTLAVSLPALCSAPANISDCPRLLKLAPNSEEAEIFKQLGSATQRSVKRKEASGAGGGAQASSGGSRQWLGAKMVGQGGHGGAWNFLALLLAIIILFLF
uniref:Bifunctional inhibitor/plant lipid transfer protein/seed storage helical domain-containing protein n=1 Tax=Ananas comosus var. bracteatus TaxID=296719 RepID=A0A6V7QAX3_ANACO|nr:unnamed protein product [Ananas comosus var. bracteatus]